MVATAASQPSVDRLEAWGITRTYPEPRIGPVDLAVAGGEIHALVGLHGAGKTTLMRLLLGMLDPDAGTVRFDGQDARTAGAAVWRRIGHMVGRPFTYGDLDCWRNLTIAAQLRGLRRAHIDNAVRNVLAELELGEYTNRRVRTLSEGVRQRLGIAAAIVHRPSLIVLDEPANALDTFGIVMLRDVLARRARAGAGVLVSCQHVNEIARAAHRISVVNRGEIIGDLDPGGVDIERAFFALVHADDVRRREAVRS